MKGKSFVPGAALALAALFVVPGSAQARLDGADRKTFIESSPKGCLDAIHKNNSKIAAKTVETYCSCMAQAEADITTAADVHYMNAHTEPPQDYRDRVRALAPACKAKADIK
jgi:hypothetical protein